MSDIDTAAVDSLKVLDPKRPIREADIYFSKPTDAFHEVASAFNSALRLGCRGFVETAKPGEIA